jgi:hypothetical protein
MKDGDPVPREGRSGWMKTAKAALIGMGAALGVTALGLDASVSLSPYGIYLGPYGPFAVIAGVPIFLNLVFALVLVKRDQKVVRYSMMGTSVAVSLVVGFLIFEGIFFGLLAGG